MQTLTLEEISRATGGKIISGSPDMIVDNITTDSRKAQRGLFIPIAGERFDGHDFIKSAFDNGADAVISHKEISYPEKAVILVKDTFEALADIARFYKEKYYIKTVSVTGSVGKTTTKDMIAGALGAKLKVIKTSGNMNNEIGVPLTVFTIEKEHEAAVIEMGMSHFGEIRKLASVVKPDIGVITNIGMSHIENLGSREGIFKAKMEIADYFGENNTLIVNGDDDYLGTLENDKQYKIIKYGIYSDRNDIFAVDIENHGIGGMSFTAVTPEGNYPVKVSVAGEHNVYNALAAICAGLEMGLDMPDIISGIENFKLTAMRMEIEKIGGITVINDCYNASPDSMRAAFGVLADTGAKRTVAVLGDILEMGEYAPAEHEALGASLAQRGIDILVTAGENAAYISKGAKENGMNEIYSFDSTDEAAEFVKNKLLPGDAVLIKASRGMKFEKIYNAVKENIQ